MKIAISVPDALFAQAEDAAGRLGVNRSQFYARALGELLDRLGADPVTQRLNELADDPSARESDVGIVAGRRLIDAGAWQW